MQHSIQTTTMLSRLTRYTIAILLLLSASALRADKAPDFSLNGLNSDHVSLQKYRNKVIYVDFWASWCVPCKQSLPWLTEMKERYGSRGFEVIGISLDENMDDAIEFLKKMKVNFDVAFDPSGKTAEQYRLEVMPSSYLIDKSGNLVHVHKGFKNNDKSQIENIIQELIRKK